MKKEMITLCWGCANNSGKCSWSKKFVPVKGWKAIPTKIKAGRASDGRIVDSFCVIECPKYVKGRVVEQ